MDVVTTMPTSFVIVDDVSLDPLDTPHASPLCSLPSPPPECHNMPYVDFHDMPQGDVSDCMDSLRTLRGYDPSLDPLDTPHASPLCSLPFPPPECHNMPYVDFHDMPQRDV